MLCNKNICSQSYDSAIGSLQNSNCSQHYNTMLPAFIMKQKLTTQQTTSAKNQSWVLFIGGPFQMLMVMLLSQHLIMSSRTSNP